MATYYVRKTGNDGNAGTTAGAAWLTIGKALGAAGIASGDTLYVGAGTYRETVTVAMTSATATTQIIADVDGSKTGDAGPVIWTAYTTNDTTAPAAAATLNLSGRDFLAFDGFYIVGGNSNPPCVDASSTVSTDITFRRCTFLSGAFANNLIRCVGTGGTALNWLIDRCSFTLYNNSTALYLTLPTVGGADYDSNFIVQNTLCIAGMGLAAFFVDTSGALANKPGGVLFYNNTIIGGQTAINFSGSSFSTSIQSKIHNSILIGGSVGMASGAASQVIENFNLIQATTARTNITAGANSVATFATCSLLDMGYARSVDLLMRPWGTPMPGSPMLGFGNQAGGPAVDALNRPRPAGGGSTNKGIGAFERHDTAIKETSVTQAGGTSAKIVGPADHDLLIPVDATATTIRIYGRYDTNHGAGSKPQVILQDAADIGVSTSTVTMTAAVDTWEQLTVGPFTPTAKGWVTLRLISRAAAGNGIAYFDTLTVT